jgi:hypothetical protein
MEARSPCSCRSSASICFCTTNERLTADEMRPAVTRGEGALRVLSLLFAAADDGADALAKRPRGVCLGVVRREAETAVAALGICVGTA